MSYDLILPFFPEEIRVLLMDPSISDLMINGISGVYAERSGQIERVKLAEAYTNERLTAAIERVARVLGQDLTHQNPILNTRLPDGSRVAVVGPPASIGGPTLTIRKFNKWYTSEELVESGSLPREVCDLIVSLIGQRKNGMIAGGTGSGKTTLMKALLDHIPMSERLCVIEQPAELQILQPQPHQHPARLCRYLSRFKRCEDLHQQRRDVGPAACNRRDQDRRSGLHRQDGAAAGHSPDFQSSHCPRVQQPGLAACRRRDRLPAPTGRQRDRRAQPCGA